MIANRDQTNTLRKTNVPYGRLARLLFAYVIGQAVKTRSPPVDMGRSLRPLIRDVVRSGRRRFVHGPHVDFKIRAAPE